MFANSFIRINRQNPWVCVYKRKIPIARLSTAAKVNAASSSDGGGGDFSLDK